MRDRHAAQFVITRATLQEARSAAGRSKGQLPSARGSCAPRMRTVGILVGVRGEHKGECPQVGIPSARCREVFAKSNARDGSLKLSKSDVSSERYSEKSPRRVPPQPAPDRAPRSKTDE